MRQQTAVPLRRAGVPSQRARWVQKAIVVSILAFTISSCGGSSAGVTGGTDAGTAQETTQETAAQETETQDSSTSGAVVSDLPPGFTMLDGLSVDDGPFEDFASIPQPGPAVFYNGSTFYRDISPSEPIVQQWALLDDAATVTRFYMTEMPKLGFEITSGFNNALVDISEVDDAALQFQLVYVYPDGRRGDMLVTPNDAIGQSSVFANVRPAS